MQKKAKCDGPTDRRTDRPTDTVTYRSHARNKGCHLYGLIVFVAGNATYKSPCRSVGRSCHTLLFLLFWGFQGLESLYLSMPLPKLLLPLPKSLLPLPKSILPLPNRPRQSSRVQGLVHVSIYATIMSINQQAISQRKVLEKCAWWQMIGSSMQAIKHL